MNGVILIAGSLAQRPGHGGHAWVFLQYLLGFKRLGWDVLFLDEIGPEMCSDEQGQPCGFAQSWNVRYFLEVVRRFGLGDSFSLSYHRGEQVLGLPREEVLRRTKHAAFLFNVMGYLSDEDILAAVPRRVFLDIDPGFGQMWRALGLADIFVGHEDYVTIGENIGQPGCDVPTCGIDWITTPQPIVLEHWKVGGTRSLPDTMDAYTSVASWRGPFGPIDYRGKRYGLRVHEFRKFISLPQRTGRPFRVAMDIDPVEGNDIAMLAQNGWTLDPPRNVAGDPWAYRDYVQRSRAEFMVAKNLYVESRGGWFSDRSICYLASGKPVVAQDTGLRQRIPNGEGLMFFSTLEEACAAVESIESDYDKHAKAARAIAEGYFDSDRVLAKLLEELLVC